MVSELMVMSKSLCGLAVLAIAATGPLHPAVASAAGTPQTNKPAVSHVMAQESAQVQALVDKYCITCHNDRRKTGDVSLQNLDAANPAAKAEIWERVVRKLRSESMPP